MDTTLTDQPPESLPSPPAEPPPVAPPPAGLPPVSAPPAVRPAMARRPSWLWIAAISVAVVVTLGGFGALYEDDVNAQRHARQLTNQTVSLNEQLLTSKSSLTAAQAELGALQTQLQHPHLGLWNVQQRIEGADWYLAGGVPDTFTYHLKVTATGPMSVSILTFEQFAAAIQCVDSGVNNTNYCMHHSSKGTVKSWLDVTSISYDFHLAEGCANYMVVFTAAKPVTVQPDVSVTYNPAPTFTGDC